MSYVCEKNLYRTRPVKGGAVVILELALYIIKL